MNQPNGNIVRFADTSRQDVARVGGKNASLGEMVQHLGEQGVAVPPGFATTADAYREFLQHNGLGEVIEQTLQAMHDGGISLREAGSAIRGAFMDARWPEQIATDICAAYRELAAEQNTENPAVAVRSSATAEDLPEASFAGQQESYLNVAGEEAVLAACQRCYASLFTDRAISYREARGFEHMKVALSVGIQLMVRSDRGAAGVMFSIDTETGCDRVVVIDAAWGLGETVVQGSVDPDEYQVFKPLLSREDVAPIIARRRGAKLNKMIYSDNPRQPTQLISTTVAEQDRFVLPDQDILQLARWACVIESHYNCPMDIEWALDGDNGRLYIVQARPETVQSQRTDRRQLRYHIHDHGRELLRGLSIGDAAISGDVCVLQSAADIARFREGAILVTENTDPDWVPIMKRAAAIVTDRGGRTSHAAIISRELGLPAIVGTGNASQVLRDGQTVTVSCAEGDQGFVYEGNARIETETLDPDTIPETRTRIMLNLANPSSALRWWRLPADGVGLARMEFVINNHIRIHPLALLHHEQLRDEAAREQIATLTRGYDDKSSYFVEQLARGLSRIAATVYPNPVIVRMSDFKTNEYANLIGGQQFEPEEENPMLGFRGASRYYSPRYRDGFALECAAILMLREDMGFDNVIVMIPFCRTLTEAARVMEEMAQHGLRRGENGLQVYVMCEVPSNVILAEQFADIFDGFSIGSNDLTQLTLGVDRDSDILAPLFDEGDAAVQWMIRHAIEAGQGKGIKVGLCGQGPSDKPEFAAWLVRAGIDSISVTPDSFVRVKQRVAAAEKDEAASNE